MENKIEIYKSADNQIEIEVTVDKETVWLNRHQISTLFDRDIKTIGKHINNVFNEGELEAVSTVAKFATVQKEGERNNDIKENGFTYIKHNYPKIFEGVNSTKVRKATDDKKKITVRTDKYSELKDLWEKLNEKAK